MDCFKYIEKKEQRVNFRKPIEHSLEWYKSRSKLSEAERIEIKDVAEATWGKVNANAISQECTKLVKLEVQSGNIQEPLRPQTKKRVRFNDEVSVVFLYKTASLSDKNCLLETSLSKRQKQNDSDTDTDTDA